MESFVTNYTILNVRPKQLLFRGRGDTHHSSTSSAAARLITAPFNIGFLGSDSSVRHPVGGLNRLMFETPQIPRSCQVEEETVQEGLEGIAGKGVVCKLHPGGAGSDGGTKAHICGPQKKI